MAGAAPHFITFANEKGGTGKSTTAVHSAVALAAQGRKVAALDLDSRQRTLGRYLDNRAATIAPARRSSCRCRSMRPSIRPGARASRRRSTRLADGAEFVVIDTPGRDDPACARGDGPRRHSGHADQRQLRRPRPDRRGRRRDLSRAPAELLRRAGLEQPHPARQGRTAQASTGSCCATACSISRRATCAASARRSTSCRAGSASGSSRASASGSSTASSSPRA